ncbi:16S rRNA (adenine(1518)-N(6)/adenine(1519)-N(6))-dimethyltransferase RsmA [Thermodesulfobacteriota bacterium]
MTSPKTLLRAWNIRAHKHLGQHFLHNPATAEKIVKKSAIGNNDMVLEIGAGLGALTLPVAKLAREVYAIEKDPRLLGLLKAELLAANLSNVILCEKDILNFDILALGRKIGRKIVVIGNLPYGISSQVVIQLIHSRSAVSRAVLMFQKELSQRITAEPGCKDYSRLTVMLRYCSDVKKVLEVKSSLFFPKPKVDSEVLEILFKDRLDEPIGGEEFLFGVIKAAFSKRRKTLKNALAGSELPLNAETAGRVLKSADIDPIRRAETLSVEEFIMLSDSLWRIIPKS